MRVLMAPDKFKGTLGAPEVAAVLAAGWRRARPGDQVLELPVADGGDGTLSTLVAALGGEVRRAKVTGPLGDPVEAEYGLVETSEGTEAIIEMARASGLELVSESRRDPLRATTRGTGELILEGVEAGATKVLVCIGGSATNDAGAGMAQALGVRLLDETGAVLPPGAAALDRLAEIDLGGLDPRVAKASVLVACDVDNPLTGPRGASAVYGPQKGASPEDVAFLDRCLGRFSSVAGRDLGLDLRDVEGAGAAGGMGAGLIAFLGARLRPGFDLVAEALDLPRRVAEADLVVTGEGRFDRQSLHGKAPAGMLRLAGETGTRAVVVAGQVEEGIEVPAERVVDLSVRFGLDAAMDRPRVVLEDAATELAESLA
jgi:glycerate kinase